jgi:predicted aldo/keto reductase-like oxidoreductase
MMGEIPPFDDLKKVTKMVLDNGVTLFDSAEGYGGGTSEISSPMPLGFTRVNDNDCFCLAVVLWSFLMAVR